MPLRLGTLHTWLRDERSGKTIHQTLMAFPGAEAEAMRARTEQYGASCGDRTIDVNGEPYAARMKVEPFGEYGDDAFQLVADYEGRQSLSRLALSRHQPESLTARASASPVRDGGRSWGSKLSFSAASTRSSADQPAARS